MPKLSCIGCNRLPPPLAACAAGRLATASSAASSRQARGLMVVWSCAAEVDCSCNA